MLVHLTISYNRLHRSLKYHGDSAAKSAASSTDHSVSEQLSVRRSPTSTRLPFHFALTPDDDAQGRSGWFTGRLQVFGTSWGHGRRHAGIAAARTTRRSFPPAVVVKRSARIILAAEPSAHPRPPWRACGASLVCPGRRRVAAYPSDRRLLPAGASRPRRGRLLVAAVVLSLMVGVIAGGVGGAVGYHFASNSTGGISVLDEPVPRTAPAVKVARMPPAGRQWWSSTTLTTAARTSRWR